MQTKDKQDPGEQKPMPPPPGRRMPMPPLQLTSDTRHVNFGLAEAAVDIVNIAKRLPLYSGEQYALTHARSEVILAAELNGDNPYPDTKHIIVTVRDLEGGRKTFA